MWVDEIERDHRERIDAGESNHQLPPGKEPQQQLGRERSGNEAQKPDQIEGAETRFLTDAVFEIIDARAASQTHVRQVQKGDEEENNPRRIAGEITQILLQ